MKWLPRLIERLDIDWLDILAFIGVCCVVYGVWQIYLPFAWIIAGLGILWFAHVMAR